VFRAPSISAVFAAYFDPANGRHQDQLLEIVERIVVELVDTGATLRRTCKVVPRRQLPAFMRPFVSSPLHYLETATWRRSDDEIDIEIRPSILKPAARPAVRALYGLSRLSDGAIRRLYRGTVSVDIALLSSRIERGIVAEFERSMPVAAACTQAFLDQEQRSLSAQT
jgi:hypothetical protein